MNPKINTFPANLAVLLISGLIILGFPPESRGETILDADRLTVSSNRTVAEGNVRLSRPDWTLSSDYLELKDQEGTKGVDARGNVTLKSEKFNVQGDRLSGSLTGEGSDEAIELILYGAVGESGSVSFSGDEIRANRVETGWELEVTGNPQYESGSTALRADTITGWMDVDGSRDSTIQKTTARGNVQLSRQGWSLTSDYLELEGEDGTRKLSAKGALQITFGENSHLSGKKVSMSKSESGWNFEILGDVKLKRKTTILWANKIAGTIATDVGKEPRITDLTAEGTSGRIELEERGGEAKEIQFLGESAKFEFDSSSELSRADFDDGSFTTCEGCEPCRGCAYSISATRTSLIEGEFVLARDSVLKSFRIPVGWSPLYFLSLKDVWLPERPYFPQIGYSSEDGLSLSGALPVFLDENHFGNLILDYFSRHQGLGFGVDYYAESNTISGIGEIYGIYRVFGDNFYKLDGTFDLDPADRLEINTDFSIKQGEYRGTNYDQNEGSLSLDGRDYGLNWKALVSRTEKSEDDEENEHVIERLPEISLLRERSLDSFPLRYGLRASLAYYREDKNQWTTAISGGRGKTGGDFRFDAPALGPVNLSLKGEGWVNSYYTNPKDGVGTRAWTSLEPGLKLEGSGVLNVQFIHRDRWGESPFDFDEIERRDRLNFTYRGSQGDISQSLSFHYDFVPDDGFSEAKYSIGFRRYSLDQKFTVNYDISGASLSSIETNSKYYAGELELNFSSGYDFAGRSISESTVGLKLSSEGTAGKVQLKGDPFETWLKEVSGELDLEFFDTWSLSLSGKYDVKSGELSSLSYSLHKSLQNCLKVGITGSKSGFWFDVKLVGF